MPLHPQQANEHTTVLSRGHHKVTQCEVIGGGAQAGAGGVGPNWSNQVIWYCWAFNHFQEREKKKTPLWWASRLEKKVEEDGFYSTTCAVCMVFVLQYLSTSQLLREKQSKTPLEGVVAGQRGKKEYSRTPQKLNEPIWINTGYYSSDCCAGRISRKRPSTLQIWARWHFLYRSSLLSWEDDGAKTHCRETVKEPWFCFFGREQNRDCASHTLASREVE